MIMRYMSTICLAILMSMACPVARADDPLIVELWPGNVPDEAGGIGAERIRMSPSLDRKQVEVN